MPHRTSKYADLLPNETPREQAIRLSEMVGNILAAARFRKMTDAEFYAELDFETEKALKAKRDK